ncbi:hypothetical protein LUX33_30045 [Actinomadura madurae]|nr:hypothetical protein [Actinomadura madurae]MCP9952259.1 hypothetical protein [Actinomadura madurae]MCP9969023.1 hypothetical protein [Actinomadura madurae]
MTGPESSRRRHPSATGSAAFRPSASMLTSPIATRHSSTPSRTDASSRSPLATPTATGMIAAASADTGATTLIGPRASAR